MADPELQRIVGDAQERMEAEPYVLKFLASARQALAGRPDADEVGRLLDKARSLDPGHPGIAELERPAPPAAGWPLRAVSRSPRPPDRGDARQPRLRRRRLRERPPHPRAARRGAGRLRRRRSPGRHRRLVAHLPDRHRPPGGVPAHRGGAQAQGRERAPGRGDLPRRPGRAWRPATPRRPGGRSSGCWRSSPATSRPASTSSSSTPAPCRGPGPAGTRDRDRPSRAAALALRPGGRPGTDLKEEILVPPEPFERGRGRRAQAGQEAAGGRARRRARPPPLPPGRRAPCCCSALVGALVLLPEPGAALPQLAGRGDAPPAPSAVGGPHRPRRAAAQGGQDRHRPQPAQAHPADRSALRARPRS